MREIIKPSDVMRRRMEGEKKDPIQASSKLGGETKSRYSRFLSSAFCLSLLAPPLDLFFLPLLLSFLEPSGFSPDLLLGDLRGEREQDLEADLCLCLD